MVATETRKSLDSFLIEQVKGNTHGVRLHQFVILALNNGFRGEQRGELTKTISRSLNRLVRSGVIHKTEAEDSVEFMA